MWTGLSEVVCVHLPACPSPLLCIQPRSNLRTTGMLQAIWRAGGGSRSPCALLGCAAGWGAKQGGGWLLVNGFGGERWSSFKRMRHFGDAIVNTNSKPPRRGKTPGCLGRAAHRAAVPPRPACGPCQAEARKQECSESKALSLFVFPSLCSGEV